MIAFNAIYARIYVVGFRAIAIIDIRLTWIRWHQRRWSFHVDVNPYRTDECSTCQQMNISLLDDVPIDWQSIYLYMYLIEMCLVNVMTKSRFIRRLSTITCWTHEQSWQIKNKQKRKEKQELDVNEIIQRNNDSNMTNVYIRVDDLSDNGNHWQWFTCFQPTAMRLSTQHESEATCREEMRAMSWCMFETHHMLHR
jgi:hypothetical protein